MQNHQSYVRALRLWNKWSHRWLQHIFATASHLGRRVISALGLISLAKVETSAPPTWLWKVLSCRCCRWFAHVFPCFPMSNVFFLHLKLDFANLKQPEWVSSSPTRLVGGGGTRGEAWGTSDQMGIAGCFGNELYVRIDWLCQISLWGFNGIHTGYGFVR